MITLGCWAGWEEGVEEELEIVLKSRYQVLELVDSLADKFACFLDPVDVRGWQ